MEFRFVSSLTPEDENAFAPAILKACAALLDQLPIAYTLRIQTCGGQVFQHCSGPTHNDHRSCSPEDVNVSSGSHLRD
jgi:hypothetical protein